MTECEKTVFLSYSHQDKEFADLIARSLLESGVEVKTDYWDVNPGDSLVRKIFEELLPNCDIVLFLLSSASTKSKWVQEELDHAMIKRIKGEARIIPVLKERCNMPQILEGIKWVDLSIDFDNGLKDIIKTAYGVSDKPRKGKAPRYVTELQSDVGGLSKHASTIGIALARWKSEKKYAEELFRGEQIKEMLDFLSVNEINDGVDELAEYGLVETTIMSSCAPFEFTYVEPKHSLFLYFKDYDIGYDPEEDIRIVATIIASKGKADGKDIQEISDLSPLRINRAVKYLEHEGLSEVFGSFGTAPFTFGDVSATRKTRRFVEGFN